MTLVRCMVSSGHSQAATFRYSAPPSPGAPSIPVLAHWLRPNRCSSGLLGQATDLAVTEAVVDEREQFPCRRHTGDHRPAAHLYTSERWGDGGTAVVAHDCFYGGPTHERRALLGYVAPVGLFVGLMVRGGEPRPRSTGAAPRQSG